MTVITRYICDRCSTSQDTPEQMWEVKLFVSHYRYYDTLPREKALWCRKCCDEFGVVSMLVRAEQTTAPPPTLEDIIRALVVKTLHDEE